jgi:hypothetical protein
MRATVKCEQKRNSRKLILAFEELELLSENRLANVYDVAFVDSVYV